MKLQDIPQEHTRPSEILHNSNWFDYLLKASRSTKHADTSRPESHLTGATPTLGLNPSATLRSFVAVSQEQRKAAGRLVQKRYAWRGYGTPDIESCAAASQEKMVTFLAEYQGTLVGTLTLGLDSSDGLLAEQTHREQIDLIRSQGRKVGELIKLAMEEGSDWKSVMDALLQSAFLMGRVIHYLNDVFIEVNPRHVRFYQRVFGFGIVGTARICARVGAPSILMHLDVDDFSQRLRLSAA